MTMSENNGKPLDLRTLQNEVAGKIQLDDGTHDVRKFNVGQYQAALSLAQLHLTDPAAALQVSIELVMESVPTLPEMQAKKLPPNALAAIIALASQGIDAVEQHFPNAASPEPSMSTSPG